MISVSPGTPGGGGGGGSGTPAPGGNPGGGGSRPRATGQNDWVCRFYRPIDNVNGAVLGGDEVTGLVPGSTYVRYCYYKGELLITELFTYNPGIPGVAGGPAPSRTGRPRRTGPGGARLHQAAGPRAEQSAPPAGAITPVNLPVWFWATIPDTFEASATADANNSATARATSTGTLKIDPGDGSDTLTCASGGIAWTTGKSDSTPGACLHTYLQPGTFNVTTTLTWTVRYEADILGVPITGTMPTETTCSTRSITITELCTRLRPN